MKFAASLILIFLGCFTGTAIASDVAAAVTADPVVSEILQQIYDAVMHGRWWAAASAVVVGLCALVRWKMPDRWKTGTRGDIIGVALVFVMAFAGAVATAAAAPESVMGYNVLITALKVAVTASGGFSILHKVIGWLMAWDKLPAWAHSILGIIASMIGSNAVKKAEAAGDAAVAAAPAPGMTGTAGKMREID